MGPCMGITIEITEHLKEGGVVVNDDTISAYLIGALNALKVSRGGLLNAIAAYDESINYLVRAGASSPQSPEPK